MSEVEDIKSQFATADEWKQYLLMQKLQKIGTPEAGKAIIDILLDSNPSDWDANGSFQNQNSRLAASVAVRALGEIVLANPGHQDLFGAEELVATTLEIAHSNHLCNLCDDSAAALGKMRAKCATEILLKIAEATSIKESLAATCLESLLEIADNRSEAGKIRKKAKSIEDMALQGYPPVRKAALDLLEKLKVPKEELQSLTQGYGKLRKTEKALGRRTA